MFEINENYEIHPDRSSYEEIWGKIIKPEINKYVSTYTGYTKMNSDAKKIYGVNIYCLMHSVESLYEKF